MKESRSSIDPIRRLGKLEAFTSGCIFQHFEDNMCCGLALGSTWRVMTWSQKAGKREAFMEII